MAFRLEKQMFAPVERWLRAKGFIFKSEFSTPWGICDLVAASFNKLNIRKRLRYGQRAAIGPMERVAILCQIPNIETGAAISIQELQQRYEGIFDESILLREVHRLASSNFIVVTSTNCFQRKNGWFPLQKKLIAIELKLNRIDEVLIQAISHRGFADESYVALPVNVAERIVQSTRRQEFEDHGVGILSVAPTMCHRILKAKCTQQTLDAVVQMHCVERFWPAIIGT